MHQTGRFSADETGLTCVNIGPPHDVTAPFLSVAGQHDPHTQWVLAGHSGVCLTTDVLGRRGRLRSTKGRLEAITTIILCIARRSSSGQPPLCANTVYKRGMNRTCPSSSTARQAKGDYSAHTGRTTLRQIGTSPPSTRPERLVFVPHQVPRSTDPEQYTSPHLPHVTYFQIRRPSSVLRLLRLRTSRPLPQFNLGYSAEQLDA